MINKLKFIYNAYKALFFFLFKKEEREKEIWLFGGHGGDLFDDNSRALFEYTVKNNSDIEAYWILNDNPVLINDVKKVGNYIIKGSVNNYFYFLKSSVVIFSHSMSSDIVPYTYVIPIIRRYNNKTFKFFTSHGIEGFKKKNTTDGKFVKLKEKILKRYDLVMSAGNIDKHIKVFQWRIDEDRVKALGMPRYDGLNYSIYKERNKIFYMPTWRNWLTSNNDIINSEYYESIREFVNSKQLVDFLTKNNFELCIYVHHLMQKYINNFNMITSCPNIKVLPRLTNVQQQIIESKIVITDYSSIAWDALYMNKQVIFYRFDLDEYEKNVGSYLCLRDKSLGPVSRTAEECISSILEFQQIEIDMTKFFSYRDQRNCERYINYIKMLTK